MKCPNCKDQNLVIAERKNIEIDHCPECRGIWLDRGELDKIIEKSKENEGSHLHDTSRRHSQSEHYQKPYKKKKSFFEELFD